MMPAKAQDAERKSLGVSPDGRAELHESAPILATLDVNDAKPMRCLRGCGAAAYLDRDSIFQFNGRKALWICVRGHDGIVALVGLGLAPEAVTPMRSHYHLPPLPCKCGCGQFVEPGRDASYRLECFSKRQAARDARRRR